MAVPQFSPTPTLIIANKGLAAARFVRLVLELDAVDAYRNNAPASVLAVEDSPLEQTGSDNLIFVGGVDHLIYPRSETALTFVIEHTCQDYAVVPYLYRFRYTLWAEDLEGPLSGQLVVEVAPRERFVRPG